MKVTSTWLLTSAAQVLITIAVGAFMIINAAVISFYVIDGYSNYRKMKALDIVAVGRVHTFDSLEFTTNPNGTQRHCVAGTANGRLVVRENANWDGTLANGDFCRKLFSTDNVSNWTSLAPTSNGLSTTEKVLWSLGFLIVFVTGAYLVATIPATMVGILAPGLAQLTKVVAMLLTLPVWLFWGVFVASAWSYHPSYWKSPDGYTVDTQKVFITSDRRMYKAPDTVFGWTSSHTMQEVKVFE